MTNPTLLSLADRVEQSATLSVAEKKRLSQEVLVACNEPFNETWWWLLDPLSSVNAAIRIVPAGWWWSVGNCSVSSDASVGPDVAHCSKDLLVQFDAGIHIEMPQPAKPCVALTYVALRARAFITENHND